MINKINKMDYRKIIFDTLNDWVYSMENQAGVHLNIIDASDIPEIIEQIAEKIEIEKLQSQMRDGVNYIYPKLKKLKRNK